MSAVCSEVDDLDKLNEVHGMKGLSLVLDRRDSLKGTEGCDLS